MTILYCFGPFEIGQVRNARPYALLMLFLAVATLGTCRRSRQARRSSSSFDDGRGCPVIQTGIYPCHGRGNRADLPWSVARVTVVGL